MKVIIDRFEGEYAVVELPDRTMCNIARAVLPAETKEGDVINISIDKQETENRAKNIKKLMDDLWE